MKDIGQPAVATSRFGGWHRLSAGCAMRSEAASPGRMSVRWSRVR